MNFLAPLMFAGLAALALPVLLHLMNRFKVKTTDWAAMRFLEVSLRRAQRRVRLEDILLLLVRCALVALAVLLFARPAVERLGAPGGGSEGPVAAVIVLDNSASMNQSTGAETRFEQAKKAIGRWLEEHEGNSMAALFLVSNRTQSLMAKPERNFPLLRRLLEDAEVTDRGSDLVEGIRLACEALREVTGLPREVHVYTDGQAVAWQKREALQRVARAHPGILIKPMFAGDGAAENLGVVSLKAQGGMPAARQSCRFQVEVANFGRGAVENVKVSLSLDGGPPVAEGIIPGIAPGATQAIGLALTFAEAGAHAVTASIPPDALPADNRRSAAFEVAAQMNVLIVEEDHAGPPMDRDGYFLANALVPLPREQAARYYLGADFVSPAGLPAELRNENRLTPQAVFLCNLGPVSEVATQGLRNYVKHGGNLVVFPGPRTLVEDWKSNAAFWDLLPAEMSDPPAEEAGADQSALAWQSSGFLHPVTALWNDSAQGSLGAVQFWRHFPLKLKASRGGSAAEDVIATGEPEVINRFVNHEPSVVAWTYGEGNVVLFNSTATPEWNNLPLHPAFVPYLQRLMGQFNRRNESSLALAPGAAFRKALGPEWRDKAFTVLPPGATEARTAGRVAYDEDPEGGAFLRFADTEKAGVYKLALDPDHTLMFAVQMDPAESDLSLAEPAALETLLAAERDAGGVGLRENRVMQELWQPLVWLVALFFLGEAVLAHGLTKKRTA